MINLKAVESRLHRYILKHIHNNHHHHHHLRSPLVVGSPLFFDFVFFSSYVLKNITGRAIRGKVSL